MATKQIFKGWEGEFWLDTEAAQPPTSVDKKGRIEEITLEIANNLERFFELGDRNATVIKEGNLEIGGTLNKAFMTKEFFEYIQGTMQDTKPYLIEYAAMFHLEDESFPTTNHKIEVLIRGMKFDTWSTSISKGELVLEDIAFMAKGPITISEVEPV